MTYYTLLDVRAAVERARERLATSACYAAPVATSIDVCKELRDAGVVCSQRDVRAACEVLSIRLADSDWAGHDGPTLQLAVVGVDSEGAD